MLRFLQQRGIVQAFSRGPHCSEQVVQCCNQRGLKFMWPGNSVYESIERQSPHCACSICWSAVQLFDFKMSALATGPTRAATLWAESGVWWEVLPGRSDRQEKSIRKASEKLGTMKGFVGAGCSCAAPNLALRLSTLPGFVRSNWFTGRRQTAGQSISCQRLRAEVRKRLIYKYHQISTICCNTLVKHDRFSPVFACLCEAVQVCKLPIFLAESWSDGSNLQALWALCSRNQ